MGTWKHTEVRPPSHSGKQSFQALQGRQGFTLLEAWRAPLQTKAENAWSWRMGVNVESFPGIAHIGNLIHLYREF